jgi:predicted transcriptional regulator
MARKSSKNLTERELEIMQIIWDLREAHLGDVQAALNRSGDSVAASTVATQLNILVNKGYLEQTGRHGRYLYVPSCSREQATKNLLDDFLDRVGLGRAPSFLIGLLKRERLSPEDRAALQDLLDGPERKRSPRSRATDTPAGEDQQP